MKGADGRPVVLSHEDEAYEARFGAYGAFNTAPPPNNVSAVRPPRRYWARRLWKQLRRAVRRLLEAWRKDAP